MSEWVTVYGLTSHSTHNRSFRRRVFPGNQLHWYWQSKTIKHNTTYTRNTKEKQKKLSSRDTTRTHYLFSGVIAKRCSLKTMKLMKNLKETATEDIANQNSVTFDESSRSLSVWHAVPILGALRLLPGNGRVWGPVFPSALLEPETALYLLNLIEIGQVVSPPGEGEDFGLTHCQQWLETNT